MTLQLIRRNGKIRGIALLREGVVSEVSGKAEYWRICEHCTTREAIVFCATHAKYVCEPCLEWHGRTPRGAFVLGYACQVMSMAVAREIAATALNRMEAVAQ